MAPTVATNLDYLIPKLRLELGDRDSSSYRYTDDWLQVALIAGVEFLMRWWKYRYLLDDDNNVLRNDGITYNFESPPIIERGDSRLIILAAVIVIRQGTLEESAWNLHSWKDSEISYSNLEGGRTRDRMISRAWDELISVLGSPRTKLVGPGKNSLVGYLSNPLERNRKDP